MKRMICIIALVMMFTGMGYVRREYIPAKRGEEISEGSRDRHLHGKARRRARRNQTPVQTDG